MLICEVIQLNYPYYLQKNLDKITLYTKTS